MGFGGALTESSASVFTKLNKKPEKILDLHIVMQVTIILLELTLIVVIFSRKLFLL